MRQRPAYTPGPIGYGGGGGRKISGVDISGITSAHHRDNQLQAAVLALNVMLMQRYVVSQWLSVIGCD